MSPYERKSMLGESRLMLNLADQISRIAPLNKPVLVLGERGTGKELVAERLHFLSNRWDKAFLKINCAAMSESLLESELFGHEAGSFTGANKRHLGRFERAEEGSLFLDELATCSLQVQEKLLRVVEYGEFERLGGQEVLQADVRLIAATNENLKSLAEKNEFRADLLDRLAFDVLHIPPLRFRVDDVLLLAEHFALGICQELGRDFFPGFSELAQDQLRDHGWPGNVRELKNAIERSVYRQEELDEPIKDLVLDPFIPPWKQEGVPLKVSETPATESEGYKGSKGGQAFKENSAGKTAELHSVTNLDIVLGAGGLSSKVEVLERKLIEEALESSRYNQKVAAEMLDLTYHQLRSMMKKYNMLPLKSKLIK